MCECYPISVYGINISFPYKTPYNAQRAIMANAERAFSQQENALLESPTGTGKSLALLASALAYQDEAPKKISQQQQENKTNVNSSPRIYYSSRTHTQLAQVVAEYKRLPYSPTMTILASRKQLCIYEPVRDSKNVDYHCRAERHNCPYAAMGNSVPDDLLKEKFDIGQLIEYCQNQSRCPFMISREMAKTANLIFCPYNYIIDPQIREQMKIELPGSIVIIDEAHNIENTCRDTAKFKMTVKEIEEMKQEIVKAMQASTKGNEWLEMLQPHLNTVDRILQRMLDWLLLRRHSLEGDEEYFMERDELITLGGWLLDSKTWPSTSESMKILIRPDKKTKSRLPDRLVLPMTRLFGTLTLVFRNNSSNLHDFKIVIKFSKEEKSDELMMLCMIPSIVFAPIAEQAHSVILSSGTLSPMNSFALELGVKFGVNLSVNHVIDPSQVAAFTISQSVDSGLKFSSSYQNLQKNKEKTIIELGKLLEKFLKIIPDGVLMFVQSYDFLRQLIEKWRSTRLFNALNKIKPVFYEEKNEISSLIQKYKDSVGSGNGGFFIGVCRGKMSEGIDFTDAQARAVFIFGIPYPSYFSADVKLKRDYNTMHSSGFSKVKLMTGDAWYDIQAYRSLFQAIGRCIRHKNDYGSIILIDERYPSIIPQFPNWVQKSYIQTPSIEAIVNHLCIFYKKMREQFPLSAGTALNLDYQIELICSKCGEKAYLLYKLNARANILVEKQGFISLVFNQTNSDKLVNNEINNVANENENENDKIEKVRCLFVQKNMQKESYALESDLKWSEEDETAYRVEHCRCGNIYGARLNSVPPDDICFSNSLWLIPDSLSVSQGANQRPLSKVIQVDEEPAKTDEAPPSNDLSPKS